MTTTERRATTADFVSDAITELRLLRSGDRGAESRFLNSWVRDLEEQATGAFAVGDGDTGQVISDACDYLSKMAEDRRANPLRLVETVATGDERRQCVTNVLIAGFLAGQLADKSGLELLASVAYRGARASLAGLGVSAVEIDAAETDLLTRLDTIDLEALA